MGNTANYNNIYSISQDTDEDDYPYFRVWSNSEDEPVYESSDYNDAESWVFDELTSMGIEPNYLGPAWG